MPTPDPHVGLLADHPVLATKWGLLANGVWAQAALDPALLELCRLRIAQLHGVGWATVYRTPAAVESGLDHSLAESVSSWPSDDRFDETAQACLAMAEMFVIDAHSVSDEQVAALRAIVGDEGVVQLTIGLAVWDGIYRLARTLPSPVA